MFCEMTACRVRRGWGTFLLVLKDDTITQETPTPFHHAGSIGVFSGGPDQPMFPKAIVVLSNDLTNIVASKERRSLRSGKLIAVGFMGL